MTVQQCCRSQCCTVLHSFIAISFFSGFRSRLRVVVVVVCLRLSWESLTLLVRFDQTPVSLPPPGRWRRHINKLVGTEEARLPRASSNTQRHSSVRWTGVCVSLSCLTSPWVFNSDPLTLLFVSQYDPFAEHRPQKIAEREDEYKGRRRQMIISPERLDPFADGKFDHFLFSLRLPHFLPPFHGSLFCDPLMTVNGFTPLIVLLNPSTTLQ